MDTSCHFLRLPLEIRLLIYGYLLLQPPRAHLNPRDGEKASSDMLDRDEEWVDEDFFGHLDTFAQHPGLGGFVDEYDQGVIDGYNLYEHNLKNTGSEEVMMYDYLANWADPPPWETASSALATGKDKRRRKTEDKCKIQRCTAILRTNRQIYDEVSNLLYSSLVMEMKPGDIMFSDVWEGIVDLSYKTWRSWPARLGNKTAMETIGYKRSSNLRGTMEPRAFARFERIAFKADLKLLQVFVEDVDSWPNFFVDNKFHTRREDEDNFVACLNGEGTDRPPVSNIFQQLVNVLQRSTHISRLDISLSVIVEPAFDIDSEDEEGNDDEENEERLRQQDEKEEKKISVANKRATELVLQAGVLNPLKRLSSVKFFELSFASIKPKPKLLGIVRDLKETVEGNFKAKHSAA